MFGHVCWICFQSYVVFCNMLIFKQTLFSLFLNHAFRKHFMHLENKLNVLYFLLRFFLYFFSLSYLHLTYPMKQLMPVQFSSFITQALHILLYCFKTEIALFLLRALCFFFFSVTTTLISDLTFYCVSSAVAGYLNDVLHICV